MSYDHMDHAGWLEENIRASQANLTKADIKRASMRKGWAAAPATLNAFQRRAGLTIDGKAGPVWNGEVRFNESMLLDPLRWKRPRKIFVCAHGDLFHGNVPDEWIDQVFAVMALSPRHEFQVLTKRPDRMAEYLRNVSTWTLRTALAGDRTLNGPLPKGPLLFNDRWPLPNVLLGVSVEDQTRADDRRDHLRALARGYGWRTFVSYEPALGPVDWAGWEFLKWMISGGESQTGARPSHPDWHRAARDFCAANGIPYLFKQWGDWLQFDTDDDDNWYFKHPKSLPARWWDGTGWNSTEGDFDLNALWVARVGKRAAGRLLDGVEHNGTPEAQP